MYKNLININLEEYLNKCCGSKTWHEESWLLKLDTFVGTLSKENLNTLRSKFSITKNSQQTKEKHRQDTNKLNEVMVACAYHPNARFIPEVDGQQTPDLFDESLDLQIEVKSLNEGKDEEDRHDNQEPNKAEIYINKAISVSELEEKKKATATFFETKKCKYLIDNAISQLKGSGKIYLIYDYNLFSRDNIGSEKEPVYTALHPAPLSKEGVKKIIENYCINFEVAHPSISIEVIYFGDLREKIISFSS